MHRGVLRIRTLMRIDDDNNNRDNVVGKILEHTKS